MSALHSFLSIWQLKYLPRTLFLIWGSCRLFIYKDDFRGEMWFLSTEWTRFKGFALFSVGWLLTGSNKAAWDSLETWYTHINQHIQTQDKKKQACKDLHTHTHTRGRVCLRRCNSTGVLGLAVCSVCLSAHQSVMLFGLQSVCCHTYSNHLPLCLYMLPFPFCPSSSLFAFLSICSSEPQNVSLIKGSFLSATESSRYISPSVSSAGGWVEERDVVSSPLPYLSLFIPLQSPLPLCLLHLPTLFPSPLFLKNKSLRTSIPVSHLSPSSLGSPCLCCPPTACSHSHDEYVSRKYYHTKWKRGNFFSFFSFLFIQHCVTFPLSQPAN